MRICLLLKIKKQIRIAETQNNFFAEVLVNLNTPSFESCPASIDTNVDPITKRTEKYQGHPSIIAIKNAFLCQSFSLETIDKDQMLQEIENLKSSKTTQESDIPTKIVKENAKLFVYFLLFSFNKCVQQGSFTSCLKKADKNTIFNKG